MEPSKDSAQEVSPILTKALALIKKREKDYQGSWRDEGLTAMVDSSYRKANYNRMRFDNSRWKENVKKTLEDFLDSINYGAFAVRLLELELIKMGIDPEELYKEILKEE